MIICKHTLATFAITHVLLWSEKMSERERERKSDREREMKRGGRQIDRKTYMEKLS